jgi:hypothetical protein
MQSIFKLISLMTIIAAFSATSLFAEAPTPIYPVDGSECEDPTVTLIWNQVTGNATFSVEIARDEAFTDIYKVTNGLSDTTYTVTLSNSRTYYWRAITRYSGSEPEYGEIVSFSTRAIAPIIEEPANDLTCVFGELKFSWEGTADAYRIEISETDDFATSVIDSGGITATEITLNFDEYGKTYFWRLSGMHVNCQSEYTAVRTFTTPQTEPQLLMPENGSLGIPLFEDAPPYDMTMVWEDKEGVDNYRVQISEYSQFTVVLVDENIVADSEYDGIPDSRFTELTELPLDLNTRYYWRVLTIKDGCEGNWSTPHYFETPFDQIHGINPADGDDCNSMKETFIWSQENSAMAYRLQVFKDQEMTDTLHNISSIADTVITEVELDEPMTTYYWRVRAEDGNNIGKWSFLKHFTTTQVPPTVFFPQNEVKGLPNTINIEWENLGDDTYTFQIARDADFLYLVVDTTGYADTNFVFEADMNNFEFFFRIKATHDICRSAWSETVAFKTAVAAPVLTMPSDSATQVSIPPRFMWDEVQGAEFYTIEIAKNEEFTVGYEIESFIEGTQAILSKELFEEKETYFWRVRAENSEGKSLWSEIFTFTTGVNLPGIPVHIAPSDRSTKIPTTVTVTWEEAYNAELYLIQVSKEEDFDGEVISNTVPTTEIELKGLENYTTYYRRIASMNEELLHSRWSETWEFRTIDAEYSEGPELKEPETGATDMERTTRLEWEKTLRVKNYEIEVSKNPNMSNPIVKQMIYTNYFYATGLDYETTYYWRVNAENEAGVGPWSEVFSFTTEDEPISGINDHNDSNEPKIFPNPVEGSAVLSFYTKSNGTVTVTIKSLNGKTVDKKHYSMSRGDHRVEIDASEYSAGTYIYIIKSDGETQNGRFLVR